jgi:hypothetical protein
VIYRKCRSKIDPKLKISSVYVKSTMSTLMTAFPCCLPPPTPRSTAVQNLDSSNLLLSAFSCWSMSSTVLIDRVKTCICYYQVGQVVLRIEKSYQIANCGNASVSQQWLLTRRPPKCETNASTLYVLIQHIAKMQSASLQGLLP